MDTYRLLNICRDTFGPRALRPVGPADCRFFPAWRVRWLRRERGAVLAVLPFDSPVIEWVEVEIEVDPPRPGAI